MADTAAGTPKKKRPELESVWRESRELIWRHRRRLAVGMCIMLVGRLAGFVLPWGLKVMSDQVIGQRRADLLMPLTLAVAAAALIPAVTTYALSNIIDVAAQRAITDMRRAIEFKVLRLPIAYFDSTKTGVLIARIIEECRGDP